MKNRNLITSWILSKRMIKCKMNSIHFCKFYSFMRISLILYAYISITLQRNIWNFMLLQYTPTNIASIEVLHENC